MNSSTSITLYGNVGGNPETRTLPAKQVTKSFYDPMIDDLVEREVSSRERELRTFSIAVSKRWFFRPTTVPCKALSVALLSSGI